MMLGVDDELIVESTHIVRTSNSVDESTANAPCPRYGHRLSHRAWKNGLRHAVHGCAKMYGNSPCAMAGTPLAQCRTINAGTGRRRK